MDIARQEFDPETCRELFIETLTILEGCRGHFRAGWLPASHGWLRL